MPFAPLTVQPVTATQDEAVAADTDAAALATPGRGPSEATERPIRRAAAAITRQLRHAINGMREVSKISHYDPKFQRPDMIEDDYYRFRHQPRG